MRQTHCVRATLGFATAAMLAALACACGSTARAADLDQATECGRWETSVRFDIPNAPQPFRLEFSPGSTALIELTELGQDLLVEAESGEAVRRVPVPLRLGSHFVLSTGKTRVSVRRLRESATDTSVEVRLHCTAAEVDALWSWLEHAEALALPLEGGIGSLDPTNVAGLIDPLATLPSEPRRAAWRAHLHAMALLVSGQTADASTQFLAAAELWQQLEMDEHARAALVAAVEDLNRTGASERVLQLVPEEEAAPRTDSYFAARLQRARCLALQYRQQAEDSQACHEQVLRRLQSLNEPIEYASTAITLASALRERGLIAEARQISEQALAASTGHQSERARADAYLQLSALASDEGDLLELLAHLRQAQGLLASIGEVRQQTVVLHRLGNTLSLLGHDADARLAAERAQQLVNERDGPNLHAISTALLARLDLADGALESGLQRSQSALERLKALGLERVHTIFSIDRARMLAKNGDTASALKVLSALPSMDPVTDAQAQLLRVELLSASADPATANSARAKLDVGRLGLAERQRVVRLDASLLWRSGKRGEALLLLQTESALLRNLSQRTGSALLAQTLSASAQPLRRAAIDLLAIEHMESPDRAQLLEGLDPWLAAGAAPGPAMGAKQPRSQASDIDQQIGRLVLGLPAAPSDRAGFSPLLDAFAADLDATPAQSSSDSSRGAISALQARGSSLVLLPGEQHALLLWLDADEVHSAVIEDWPAIDAALGQLDALAQRADSSVREIAASADALSASLLGSLAGRPRPQRLHVLAMDSGRHATWPLLRWPGDDFALGEQIPISLLQLSASAAAAPTTAPALHVLQATQRSRSAEGAPLAPLLAAESEARLLNLAFADRPVQVLASARRENVIEALAERGAWVHVSAHGSPSPGLLLGSGLWLDATAEHAAPEFLSSLDILARGAAAELVVLNACQLAATGKASAHTSMDFATAISRAGVRHVIAARHPVSDTASTLWVPAFYADLRHGSASPADALLAARKRLMASRAFRHPFHWAGWVHIESIALADE